MAMWMGMAAFILFAAFSAATYSRAMAAPPRAAGDETAFFDEACWIREHGGFTGWLRASFQGTYPYDNRHPLLQLAAAPVAERSLRAVRPMRAVAVALAIASLALVFIVACRAASLPISLALVALLSVSANWLVSASAFTIEPIIYAFVFLAWVLIAGAWQPRGRWLLAGAAAGMAYLSKGTAMLLLFAMPPALLIHVWVLHHRRAFDSTTLRTAGRTAALFLTGFILVALPLLWRNAIVHSSPLHNSNSELMWMDDFSAAQIPRELRPPGVFTLTGYLQRHTAREIATRMAYGLYKQARRTLGAFATDAEQGRAVRAATQVVSMVIVLMGIAALAMQRRTWLGTYSLSLLLTSFLLFAWYSYITDSNRFMSMCMPMLGLQALIAGIPWIRTHWHGRASEGHAPLLLAGLAALLLITQIAPAGLRAPRGDVPTTPDYQFLCNWYRQKVVGAGAITFQTRYLSPRYEFAWLFQALPTVYEVPPLQDYAALDEYMRRKGAQYLVVERDSLHTRLPLLAGYFGHDAEGNLELRALPPGWRLHGQNPHPKDFLILEHDASAPSTL